MTLRRKVRTKQVKWRGRIVTTSCLFATTTGRDYATLESTCSAFWIGALLFTLNKHHIRWELAKKTKKFYPQRCGFSSSKIKTWKSEPLQQSEPETGAQAHRGKRKRYLCPRRKKCSPLGSFQGGAFSSALKERSTCSPREEDS